MWFTLAIACRARDPVASLSERLDTERRALHIAETVLLYETAHRALEGGNPKEAASAAVLGMEIDAERFQPVLDALIRSEDPDVLATLSKTIDSPALRERKRASDTERRYSAGIPDAWHGVDRKRGLRIIEGIRSEYAVEPDIGAMDRAVDERFSQLAAHPRVRSLFFSWSGEAKGADALARIDGAITAGLPESVAVAEGVEAALSALDPYTVPIWPSMFAGWQEHHAGVTLGVGLDLQDAPDGRVIVVSLDVGGPAWRAGVHVGDVLSAVEGIAGPATASMDRLRGAPDSEVRLTLLRGEMPIEIIVARERIPEETVQGFRRTISEDGSVGWEVHPEPGITLIRISAFRPHTDEQFDLFIPEDPGVLLLDLRGNSGGDVMAAVNVADRFVSDGVLVTLEGRTIAPARGGDAGELPWNVAVPGHPLEQLAGLFVLVNRHTASAAEIVAGALRDRANAVLIGEPTFGKGLSQALRVDEALEVGWQVTNGSWMLPSGAALEPFGAGRKGLSPEISVVLSPAERLQVDAMRRRREMPPLHPDGTVMPDLGTVSRRELPLLSDDPQLSRALSLARERISAR